MAEGGHESGFVVPGQVSFRGDAKKRFSRRPTIASACGIRHGSQSLLVSGVATSAQVRLAAKQLRAETVTDSQIFSSGAWNNAVGNIFNMDARVSLQSMTSWLVLQTRA